jgi:superfamily I DNA/RNA helicase
MPFEFHLPALEEMRASPDGLAMIRMVEDDDFRTALITGCPGSGKTTVSIQRLVRLSSQGLDVRLITYQNLLVVAIRHLARLGFQAPQVSTFHKWYCPLVNSGFNTDSPPTAEEMIVLLDRSNLARQPEEEVLIDEGQDLPVCVYQVLPRYFKRCLVGADNGQRVHEDGARTDDIEGSLQMSFAPYRRFELGRNFRNTYETYRFARQFIPPTNLSAWDENILARLNHSERRGRKPSVIAYRDINRRNEHLYTVLNNLDGNVAILCPLGPLPKKSTTNESVDEVYDLVTGMGFPATKYHHNAIIPDDLERYVVTTFKSVKGMEFDHVVIPRINFWKAPTISEEWYVACTRTSGRLIIYRDLCDSKNDPINYFELDTYEAESLETEGHPLFDAIEII